MNSRQRIIPPIPALVLRAADYTWHDRDGSARPGVGIFIDRRLIQHLDADQAIRLSNQLVDAAEAVQP